jgi:hypothetical protein
MVIEKSNHGVKEQRLRCWSVMVMVLECNGHGVGE